MILNSHIWPINDLREHETEDGNQTCWCQPTVEVTYCEESGMGVRSIIHNAMDQREKYETGELKPH